MKSAKTFFSIILVLTVSGVVAYAAYNRGFFKDKTQANQSQQNQEPLINKIIPSSIRNQVKGATTFAQNQTDKLKNAAESEQVQSLTQSASNQVQTLVEKSDVVTDHVDNVVQVNEEDKDKSVSDQALEYGQYLYCKQVVETYESDNSGN